MKVGDIVEITSASAHYHLLGPGWKGKVIGFDLSTQLITIKDNLAGHILDHPAAWKVYATPSQQTQQSLQAAGVAAMGPLIMFSGTSTTINNAANIPVPTIDKPKKKRAPRKKKEIAKSPLLVNVIMSPDKREEIQSVISQIDYTDLIFETWGFNTVFEKGTAISLLFYGIAGTGKTLTALAIANEMNKNLKIIGTADIESSEPGGAERNMKDIFRYAKEDKNTVLLFDECDSLLTDRNEVGVILGAQINTLLQEIENYTGVIIFTTNRLGKLDPALERRITAKIEFSFPSKEQRLAIWERLIPSKAPIDKSVDFNHLAEYPIAGGNIKNVVLNAARNAAYLKSSTIKMEHFVKAIEKEAKSIQAFAQAYEEQTHVGPLGKLTQGRGGLTISKRMTKMASKTSSFMGGNNK